MKKTFLAFLVGASLLGTTALTADSVPSTSDPVVQAYATEHGITVEVAAQALSTIRAAAALAAEIESDSPNDFAGIKVSGGAQPKIEILATTSVKGRSSERARALGAKDRAVPRSRRALLNAQERVVTQLARQGIQSESDINPETGEVVVYVIDEGNARPAARALLENLPFVKVIRVDSLPQTSLAVQGGMSGDGPIRADGSQDICTVGYGALRAGVRGFVTAGHCPNTMTVSGVSFPIVQEVNTGDSDVQFHTRTGHTYSSQYISGDPAYPIQVVSGTTALVVGMPLCKYGRTTRLTCGTVTSVSVQITSSPRGSGNFARIKNYATAPMAAGGDSGGPVYAEYGYAAGITHAVAITGAATPGEMYFMPIARLSSVGASLIVN